MPSGSVTLLEAAKCGTDVLKRGVVETIIQESPILARLPIMTIQGNALRHTVEESLPDLQFRNVNEGYTRVWATDTEHYWGTSILGGEVFVDNYLVRTRGNVTSVKARQYAKVAKSAALTFDKTFFDGTGTAKDFKGVNALIDEGFGQKWGAAADAQNGGALTLDDLDYAHDLLRSQAYADVILLNRTVRRKITKLGRDNSQGYALIDVGTDQFGRQVTMWNGVPLAIVGDDKNGNLILDYDESRGSSSVTTSIYFVAFGTEENVCGLMGAGGTMEVVDFGETEAAPGHLGRIEFYPGICIFNPHSIVRLAGITNA
jgi:hypothetical protein